MKSCQKLKVRLNLSAALETRAVTMMDNGVSHNLVQKQENQKYEIVADPI